MSHKPGPSGFRPAPDRHAGQRALAGLQEGESTGCKAGAVFDSQPFMALLPQKLEGKLGAPLFREEKEQSMPYITSVERRRKEKALARPDSQGNFDAGRRSLLHKTKM
jgi:hypothetical protein